MRALLGQELTLYHTLRDEWSQAYDRWLECPWWRPFKKAYLSGKVDALYRAKLDMERILIGL